VGGVSSPRGASCLFLVAVNGLDSREDRAVQAQTGLVFDAGCVRFITIERAKAALIELQFPTG